MGCERPVSLDVEEFLTTPRVQKVALRLQKVGPMTFRQFKEAPGFWDQVPADVRDKMDRWGLIEVSWQNKKTQLITLTAFGETFAALTRQQLQVVEDAMAAKERVTRSPPGTRARR